ncbi:MAG: MFS transporter, partial [Mycobacteriales bacterium]
MAMLDGTVVNVALRAIGKEFDASFAALQWTVNGYTLTLASLILVGGSFGDRFGRRRVFLIGVLWFAVASLLCGAAPNVGVLIAARALQGIGGALLTPGSLAIISASFAKSDRSAAVGAWSGLGGIAAAAGPLVGGWLLELNWRWVFFVNAPVALAALLITVRHVPESRNEQADSRVDIVGAALTVIGLAGLTYSLTSAGDAGMTASVLASGVTGIAALTAFMVAQQR